MMNLRTTLFVCVLCLNLASAAVYAQRYATQVPALNAAAKPDPLPSIDGILNRFMKASGGKSAIESLTSEVLTGTFEDNDKLFPLEIVKKFPGKYRLEARLPEGDSFTQGSDGSKAWVHYPQKKWREMLPDEMLEANRSFLNLRFASQLRENYPNMKLRGKDRIGDDPNRPVYIVEATPTKGHARVFFFDTDTGVLLRMDSTLDTEQGPIKRYDFFEDYEDFHGAMVPHTIREACKLHNFIIRIDKIRRNVALDDKQFEKPEWDTGQADNRGLGWFY